MPVVKSEKVEGNLETGELMRICSFYYFTVCSGIRLEAVVVPQFRFRGQNATLLCRYELEPEEELFSLKWYKEETEFYRQEMPVFG